MRKQVLVDVTISCEPPAPGWHYRSGSMEETEKHYEVWVEDFHEFIRDHRSQDPVRLNVEREYEDQCSFCQSTWDTDDDGCPCCCDEAVKEWEENKREGSDG